MTSIIIMDLTLSLNFKTTMVRPFHHRLMGVEEQVLGGGKPSFLPCRCDVRQASASQSPGLLGQAAAGTQGPCSKAPRTHHGQHSLLGNQLTENSGDVWVSATHKGDSSGYLCLDGTFVVATESARLFWGKRSHILLCSSLKPIRDVPPVKVIEWVRSSVF